MTLPKLLFVILLTVASLVGQRRVEPSQTYYRVYAVAPMVGKGTWADPKRPLVAPVASQLSPADRNGILGFHHQISDDGNFALVEIVAASPSALAAVTAQLRGQAPGLQVLDAPGRSRTDIENAFKAKKKDFRLDRFALAVP